jgi:very-short-patch-repair endonuclease
MWDDYKVAAEIDGAQHTEDPFQRWDDMERDNDLTVDGYRTLRFPAWLVRQRPEVVAAQIRRALHGCVPLPPAVRQLADTALGQVAGPGSQPLTG